jgi:Ca2+-binding RTX toxin-like protein
MATPITLTAPRAIHQSGEYSVANDQWGTPRSMQGQPGSTSQMTINDPEVAPNNISVQWQFPDYSSPNAVWGYLQVYWGGGPGWEAYPPFRTTVSNIKDFTLDYSVSQITPGSNLLIEVWTTNAQGQATTEVGVVAAGFRNRPSFTYSDQYITAGVNPNSPMGDTGNPNSRFIQIGLTSDQLSGTISFSNILAEMVRRGLINPNDFVQGLSLGVEPVRGSGTMQIDRFAVFQELFTPHLITYNGTRSGQIFDITTNNDYVINGGPLGVGTSIVRINTPLATARIDLLGNGHIDVTAGRYGNIDLSSIGEIRFSDQRVPVSALAVGPAATGGADYLEARLGAPEIHAGLGNDTVTGVLGWATATYLRGDEGDDSMIGGAGFDDINGNMGADTIDGGPGGNDWLVGGRDNDFITARASNNILYGNLGDDILVGGGGNDVLRGGQDNDSVSGGDGADFISGDRGSDTLAGGAGADIFHIFNEAGLDRVIDFRIADGDRVQLLPGTQYTVSQSGADTVISLSGGAQMVLAGVSLSAGSWIFGA